MARKSLVQLFVEIDYSNIVERHLSGGYKILDKYIQRYPQNIIGDESIIERFLAKYFLELGLHDGNNYDVLDNYSGAFYGLSLELLEKKYPPSHNPPKTNYVPLRSKYDHEKIYSYKTVRMVTEIMITGVSGGLSRILEDLVILYAEDKGRGKTIYLVDKFLDTLYRFEDRTAVQKEYLEKYSKYIPSRYQNDKESAYSRASFDLRDALIEHPKMMHRMKSSLYSEN